MAFQESSKNYLIIQCYNYFYIYNTSSPNLNLNNSEFLMLPLESSLQYCRRLLDVSHNFHCTLLGYTLALQHIDLLHYLTGYYLFRWYSQLMKSSKNYLIIQCYNYFYIYNTSSPNLNLNNSEFLMLPLESSLQYCRRLLDVSHNFHCTLLGYTLALQHIDLLHYLTGYYLFRWYSQLMKLNFWIHRWIVKENLRSNTLNAVDDIINVNDLDLCKV